MQLSRVPSASGIEMTVRAVLPARSGSPASVRLVEWHVMDRLLTADELAERLGMKTDWVWAQARAGRIPHVRLGRYRRFRESAVEAWLHDLETGGAPSRSAPRATPLRRSA
jgi:excisionase family DNA binding protein